MITTILENPRLKSDERMMRQTKTFEDILEIHINGISNVAKNCEIFRRYDTGKIDVVGRQDKL